MRRVIVLPFGYCVAPSGITPYAIYQAIYHFCPARREVAGIVHTRQAIPVFEILSVGTSFHVSLSGCILTPTRIPFHTHLGSGFPSAQDLRSGLPFFYVFGTDSASYFTNVGITWYNVNDPVFPGVVFRVYSTRGGWK